MTREEKAGCGFARRVVRGGGSHRRATARVAPTQKRTYRGRGDPCGRPQISANAGQGAYLASMRFETSPFRGGGLLYSRTAACRCRWQKKARRSFRCRAICGPLRSRPGNGNAARRARGLAPSSSPAALSSDISARFFDSLNRPPKQDFGGRFFLDGTERRGRGAGRGALDGGRGL